ncbi:SDR family oxidoreductase [Zunongwangia endophytica]|uniref:SDR family oxidoreductase n=1 Tax=Zunongwangia endophytica TaxID=1808945 RepID=A0ABV8HAN1_9FLAO|nr:NAD(P)H-binding protein [Zunongwangia endophytica]MDN3593943.1 NAD(P)H-binding protein [Zunongwangia endophytica]
METTILIVGASGELGMHLVQESKKKGFKVRALTRSEEGFEKLREHTDDIWRVDASSEKNKLHDITKGVEYIVSALGKSISLFHPTPNSFYENNYKANANIIADAKRNNVKRFFYVSMKGADSASEFTIPRMHKKVEDELEKSGLDYSVIRPVGFFSGLDDLVIMAKRKVIPLIGDGQAKTNSIYHGDLANYIMTTFLDLPKLIEIGGPSIHTREEMAEMIQKHVGGKIIKLPTGLAKVGSNVSKLISKEQFGHKLSYFTYIMTHDMIASKRGFLTFDDYLQNVDLNEIK